MEITKLSLQRKSKAFNIFIDGKFSFSLEKDEVVKERLCVGLEIPEKRLTELKFKGKISYLISRMFNFLSFRPRSVSEVKRKLGEVLYKEKELSKELKEEATVLVIERLKKLSLLNDEEFAKWFIAQRKSQKSPFGKNRIKSELYKKGVDRKLTEELLAEDSSANEEARAITALQKKERLFSKYEGREKRNRAFTYLVRLGFGFDTVYSVVDTFFKRKYNDTGLED